MKKIHRFSSRIYFFNIILVSMYLFIFNTSCGLESIDYIAAPKSIERQPLHGNSYEFRDFVFKTNELRYSSNEDFSTSFQGTDIYYKIYNNYNTLQNERSRIETLASDTDTQEKATTTLISSYNYKPLKCSDYNNSPLIPAISDNSEQRVYIRLTDYYDLENFQALIMIDGEKLNGNKSKPLRTDGKSTFNFGNGGENDLIPGQGTASDLSDYSSTTATEQGLWMVCMFAVGVGLNETLTPIYSYPLYLGCVDIKESSNDN